MINKILYCAIAICCIAVVSCKHKTKKTPKKNTVQTKKRIDVPYAILTNKDTIANYIKGLDSTAAKNIAAINRADPSAVLGMDTILTTANNKQPIEQYFPFPFYVAYLEEIPKIIYFSYPTQSFAAYEYGQLLYTGPTSMGRKADKTPTGLFYTNWKAEQTTSTFNDEWDLKWNFNIENKLGVGFHQYALPGYPASHSCLRLYAADAQKLYSWADQWVLKDDDKITAHGTPVVVFGDYTFGAPKPWLALTEKNTALQITDADIKNITAPYLQDITAKQQERNLVEEQ